MLPREWDRFVGALAAREAELKAAHQDEHIGYLNWQKTAVHELPAGVFLWRDEFEAGYRGHFASESMTILGERDGDRALTYAPLLEPEVRSRVLEGLEACAGGTGLREQYALQEAAKKAAGRHTLEEAAQLIAEATGERYEALLGMLRGAAGKTLPVYEPGRNARMRYGFGPGEARVVRDFYEEARWDELNEWLAAHEPHIGYRFPAPDAGGGEGMPPAAVAAQPPGAVLQRVPQQLPQRPHVHSLAGARTNALSAIVESVALRVSTSTEGWVELERLARLDDPPPPLKSVDSAGIRYDEGGSLRTLNKRAGKKRLERVMSRANVPTGAA